MESTKYSQSETVSSSAPEAGIHTFANRSRPGSSDEPSLMRGFNAFRRDFALAQAKLEELVADRAASNMLRAADADMYRTKVKTNCTVADDAFTSEGAPPRRKQSRFLWP